MSAADDGTASTPPVTGHERLDAALAELPALAAQPVEQHLEPLTAVHDVLRASLRDSAEESRPTGPGAAGEAG